GFPADPRGGAEVRESGPGIPGERQSSRIRTFAQGDSTAKSAGPMPRACSLLGPRPRTSSRRQCSVEEVWIFRAAPRRSGGPRNETVRSAHRSRWTMLQHEVIVRKGWSWGLLPLLAAALVACGSEEDDGAGGKEEPLGPARVVFAVENLDLLGPVTVQALGRTWVFAPTEGGEAAVTECGEDAVEVEAEEIAVTATSQAGFEWEFTRSLRRGECNVVPVSLENPTTAIL